MAFPWIAAGAVALLAYAFSKSSTPNTAAAPSPSQVVAMDPVDAQRVMAQLAQRSAVLDAELVSFVGLADFWAEIRRIEETLGRGDNAAAWVSSRLSQGYAVLYCGWALLALAPSDIPRFSQGLAARNNPTFWRVLAMPRQAP